MIQKIFLILSLFCLVLRCTYSGPPQEWSEEDVVIPSSDTLVYYNISRHGREVAKEAQFVELQNKIEELDLKKSWSVDLKDSAGNPASLEEVKAEVEKRLQEFVALRDSLDRLSSYVDSQNSLGNWSYSEDASIASRPGRISYGIADSMKVNQVARVAIRIAPAEPGSYELQEMTARDASVPTKNVSPENIELGELRAYEVMRARLLDPTATMRENFKIVPLGSEEQILDDNSAYSAGWQWDVIPLTSGTHQLNLIIEAKVKSKDDRTINIPVYTKLVTVTSKNEYVWPLAIVGSLLLGLIVWLSTYSRKGLSVRRSYPLTTAQAEQARNYITNGQTLKAVNYLEPYTRKVRGNLRSQLGTFKASLRDVKLKSNTGVLDHSEVAKVMNGINFGLLELISELEEKE